MVLMKFKKGAHSINKLNAVGHEKNVQMWDTKRHANMRQAIQEIFVSFSCNNTNEAFSRSPKCIFVFTCYKKIADANENYSFLSDSYSYERYIMSTVQVFFVFKSGKKYHKW